MWRFGTVLLEVEPPLDKHSEVLEIIVLQGLYITHGYNYREF
jgi:hypothetical protein